MAATIADLFVAYPDSNGAMLEALKAAELYDQVTGASFAGTLLAPSDAAFASLLGTLGVSKSEMLASKGLLRSVLSYHVLPQMILRVEGFASAGTIATLLSNHSIVPTLGSTLGLKGELSSAGFQGVYGLVGVGAVSLVLRGASIWL